MQDLKMKFQIAVCESA